MAPIAISTIIPQDSQKLLWGDDVEPGPSAHHRVAHQMPPIQRYQILYLSPNRGGDDGSILEVDVGSCLFEFCMRGIGRDLWS